MGSSASGNGNLSAYGVVNKDNFKSSVYTIARLRFNSLTDVNPFSVDYEKIWRKKKRLSKELVADNGQARLEKMKKDAQKSLDEGKKQLDEAETNLVAGKKRLQETDTQLQGQEVQLSQFPEPQQSQISSQIEQAKEQLKQEKEKLSQAETDFAKEKAKWQASQDEVKTL